MELVTIIVVVAVLFFGGLYVLTRRANAPVSVEHTACGTEECCGTCDTATVELSDVAVVVTNEEPTVDQADDGVDLTAMKKDALLAYAKEKGIKISSSMTKQALIDAINAA